MSLGIRKGPTDGALGGKHLADFLPSNNKPRRQDTRSRTSSPVMADVVASLEVKIRESSKKTFDSLQSVKNSE